LVGGDLVDQDSFRAPNPQRSGDALKAIVYHEYGSPGDVLELEEVDRPVVKDDEVLVRVHAASVNFADYHYLMGTPYIIRTAAGLAKPKNKILGRDVAGRVEAVGSDVTRFHTGDEVFGEANFGAYAEYVCVPEDWLALKPANLTFEQAAAVPIAGVTALQGLRDVGRVQLGQRVLINGASGGVGTFAVQIAKSFGAEVTGVCSKGKMDLVRSIGADHVIDYTQEDFTRTGQHYDLILDMAGNRSLTECRRVLNPKGVYVSSTAEPDRRWVGSIPRLIKAIVLSPFVSQKMTFFAAKQAKSDLVVLRELIEAGEVTPVIDSNYKLSEVPEALTYYGEGHAQGKTVITVL
jgi:NADPH:quinone reductase-like Zn-dependent oxidoreductase